MLGGVGIFGHEMWRGGGAHMGPRKDRVGSILVALYGKGLMDWFWGD